MQLVAFKRQNYTQNDVKMAILVSRVQTTGELGAPLNNTWAPLKTCFVESRLIYFLGGGSQKILTVILTCNFSFVYCDHRGLLCVKLQQQKSLINA